MKTTSFYNRFSSLYPLVDYFLKPQKKVMFEEINLLPHGKLLEIGVGNGAHFKRYKKHRITGIDTSDAMLAIAAQNSYDHITVLKMNGEDLLFDDNEFDYVVLSHVIAVVDDAGQLLTQVHRVLKPQGQLFILNHFTPDNWLKYVDRAFSIFSKMFHFRSCFRIEEIAAFSKFTLLKEIPLGMASYFKILICRKS